METKSVRIPTRDRRVNIFLVDSRGIPRVCHLTGMLRIPLEIMVEGARVRWRIKEFKTPPVGLTMDVESESVSLVFPFIDPEDAKDWKSRFLSFDDIINLFKQYESKLMEVSRT